MRAKDCMSTDVICTNEKNTICEVAKLMSRNHIGCIPVCNENSDIVGIVTDRDIILRSIADGKDINQLEISEIMTKNVIKTSPDTDVNEVSKIMCKNQIRRIPVVKDEKVQGIITLGDLANNNNIPDEEVINTLENVCQCGQNVKNAQ